MRITVFGTGYLGVVQAACLAEAGFDVLGVDTDKARVAMLGQGRPGIHEPGLTRLLRRGLAAGRLAFTTSYRRAAAHGDVHFICVGTPRSAAGWSAQVRACLAALTPLLTRRCLVVGKSTVPAGTAQQIAGRLAEATGGKAELAWNPEFLREGHAVADSRDPDRIVVGVSSQAAERTLRRVYRAQLARGVPFVVTSLATAELVKLAANAFLATKISFINAMAEICEASGADAGVLAAALGYDKRIGADGLRPGLGFGGGCLPKDIAALGESAARLGVPGTAALLGEVSAANRRRRARMVQLARELAGGSLDGATVGVLGLAFKAGTDDVRDSPALDVAASVRALGARVRAYDPAAARRARTACPDLELADSVLEAARGADVLLVLTGWPEFAAADPDALARVARRANVADGPGVLDPGRWRSAGWRYASLGTRTRPAQESGRAEPPRHPAEQLLGVDWLGDVVAGAGG